MTFDTTDNIDVLMTGHIVLWGNKTDFVYSVHKPLQKSITLWESISLYSPV